MPVTFVHGRIRADLIGSAEEDHPLFYPGNM